MQVPLPAIRTLKSGGDASGLNPPPLSIADLFFIAPDDKLAGIIELKPWWRVDEAQIEQVRAGTYIPTTSD